MLEKIKSAPLVCQIIFYFMCFIVAVAVVVFAIFCPIVFLILTGYAAVVFVLLIFVSNTMFIFCELKDREWILPDFLKIRYKKWLDKQNKK